MRKFKFGLVVLATMVVLGSFVGCSTVKYVTPKIPETIVGFESLPANSTEIMIRDLRGVTNKDKLCERLQKHLETALNTESKLTKNYILKIDVLDYKAHPYDNRTMGAILSVHVVLEDDTKTTIGKWDIEEVEKLVYIQFVNTINSLATDTSQQAYNKVVAKIISSVDECLKK